MDPEEAKLLRLILAELRKHTRLLAAAADAEPEETCPLCGSLELEDTPAHGHEGRKTCLKCGRSFEPEVVNG